MIAFTSDIDWAPEEVIKDMLEIFEDFEVPCTLFCTHSSEIIKTSNRSLFEIGIHPNFNELLFNESSSTADRVVSELLNIYPEAKGVRSHCMTQSSRLLNVFKSNGLIYDSNQFLPYNYGLKPYTCWTGLKRIPYNWEDDVHFEYGKSFDYDIFSDYVDSKFIVMNFHPIHVYLNTDTKATYEKAKPFYHKPNSLLELRNVKKLGTRDFLITTLKEMRDKNIKAVKLMGITC